MIEEIVLIILFFLSSFLFAEILTYIYIESHKPKLVKRSHHKKKVVEPVKPENELNKVEALRMFRIEDS